MSGEENFPKLSIALNMKSVKIVENHQKNINIQDWNRAATQNAHAQPLFDKIIIQK